MAGCGSDRTGEAGAVWRGGVRYVLVWQARHCVDWKGVDWSGRYGGDGYGKVWLVEAGRARFGGACQAEVGSVAAWQASYGLSW